MGGEREIWGPGDDYRLKAGVKFAQRASSHNFLWGHKLISSILNGIVFTYNSCEMSYLCCCEDNMWDK